MEIHVDASRACVSAPTGVGIYVCEIIRALVAAHPEDQFFLYAPAWAKSEKCIDTPNVSWKFLPWPPKYLWTQVCLSFAWARAARTKTKKVFFTPGHVAPFFAPRNLVITIHDIAFFWDSESYSWSEKLFAKLMTRRNIFCAKKILVPSNETKNKLIELLHVAPEKIVVTPLALPIAAEPSAFLPAVAAARYILAVGRVEYKKGIDRLVRAFEKINTATGAQLLLAGPPGVGYEKIKLQIAASPAHSAIHELGFVDNATRAALYEHAAVFVFPTRYEGFGLPLLEAFAASVPVVAWDSGSVCEVADEAAKIVSSEDELSAAVITLLQNETARHELISRGRERLQNFSWEKTAALTYRAL